MKSSTRTKLNLLATLSLAVWVLLVAVPASAGSLDDAARARQSGDYKKAFKIFKPLAGQGNAIAQYNLGSMYDKGQGVTRDYAEAIKWYRKSADQGEIKAQYNMGGMYQSGVGTARDFKEAIKWYRKAADQGLAEAQYNLGYMYYQGQGVSKDPATSAKWYGKAAEQGLVQAQFNMALMYDKGQGVSKDIVQAYKWFSLTFTRLPSGSHRDKVNTYLNTLRKKMAPAQVSQAEKLVREWQAQNKGK